MNVIIDYFDVEELLANELIDTSQAQRIVNDEGVRTTEYKDTRGNWTVGIGHNLTVPISADAIQTIYLDDIVTAIQTATNYIGEKYWSDLSPTRKGALLNMAFNLGAAELRGFVKLRACIFRHDYPGAAREMLNSVWAREVGQRAIRLAKIMGDG